MSGRLLELGALRYTPAGVAAVEFKLAHESQQDEAGGKRTIQAEVAAIAFETQARLIASAKLGMSLKLQGFLGAKHAVEADPGYGAEPWHGVLDALRREANRRASHSRQSAISPACLRPSPAAARGGA